MNRLNLSEMLACGSNITVSVSLDDLRQFHKEVIADTKQELEAQIVEDKAERYLSVRQLCEMLSIDPSTLWRWKKRGYIVPIEVGGKRRYRMSDVRRILNNGRD